jgi:hypothetical protein
MKHGVAVSRDLGVVIPSSSGRESLHMFNQALALRLKTEATFRRMAYSMSLIDLSRTNARLRDLFNPLLRNERYQWCKFKIHAMTSHICWVVVEFALQDETRSFRRT